MHLKIKVMDITGNYIPFTSVSKQQKIELDNSGVAGMYFIQLINDNQNTIL